MVLVFCEFDLYNGMILTIVIVGRCYTYILWLGYLRSFYFKFIHKALPCNYTLYKMKITQRYSCSFCCHVWQTILHIFLGMPLCSKVMENNIYIFTAENIDTGMCNILLCTYNKEKQMYTLMLTIKRVNIFYMQICRQNT